jgi:hypothetical protein
MTWKSSFLLAAVWIASLLCTMAEDKPVLVKSFTANEQITSGSQVTNVKVYITPDKLRFDISTGGLVTIQIYRFDLKQSYTIIPTLKMSRVDTIGSDKIASILPEGTWSVLGPDKAEGILCTKYSVTKTDGEKDNCWIDAGNHLIVHASDDNAVRRVYSNIVDGPPAASCFDLPKGFRQVDASKMH